MAEIDRNSFLNLFSMGVILIHDCMRKSMLTDGVNQIPDGIKNWREWLGYRSVYRCCGIH